jgi:hypothetical protein
VREWGLYPFNCTIWKVHVDRPDPLERLALGNKNLKASPALNYGIG